MNVMGIGVDYAEETVFFSFVSLGVCVRVEKGGRGVASPFFCGEGVSPVLGS